MATGNTFLESRTRWCSPTCADVVFRLYWRRSIIFRVSERGVPMAYASLMGVRIKRKEDPRLITGIATYVGDMTLPGMRHVAFVRSPYAHANIRGIDTAAALAHPGVFAVVTGADLAPLCEPMPVATSGESGSSDGAPKRYTHHAL